MLLNNIQNNQLFKKSNLFALSISAILSVYLFLKQPTSLLITVVLLFSIVFYGSKSLNKLSIIVKDSRLMKASYLWSIKILISFILLEFGWIPDLLNQNSDSWGYDPQRFYLYAKNLVENNWVITDFLNYQGVTFFYGGIFYIFGANPYIPALINSLITLLILINLIKYLNSSNLSFKYIWLVFLIFLLPEAIWFDILTSREMLLASILCLITIEFSKLVFNKNVKLSKSILSILFGIIMISILRMTVIIPVFLFFILLSLTTKSSNFKGFFKYLFLTFLIAVPIVAPILNSYFGGFNSDYSELFETTTKASENVAQGFEFSSNSVAVLLMPNGILESILFLPFRMILYLISPLPALNFSIFSLYNGSYYAWQNLLVVLSSLINIVLFPYCLSGFIDCVKHRESKKREYAIHLSFFLILVSIAGGNLIIHERYRVMADILMIVSAWLSYYQTPKKLKFITIFIWYLFLFVSTISYFIFKTAH